jgi:hypothetical protein
MLHSRRRPRRSRRAACATLALAAAFAATPPAASAASCTTATRRNLLDPDGAFFANRFRSPAAIHAAGDLLFAARPRFDFEKLYLSREDGGLEIVAETLGNAPNDAVIAGNIPFRQISVNEAGDLAFLAHTTRGWAALARKGAGALEVAAGVGRESPLEARWHAISQLSSINESGVVAFVADLRDGTHGVFSYDATTDTDAVLRLAGLATAGGRELCFFQDLELSDTGTVAIVAGTRIECDDDTEPVAPGLFLSNATGVETVLLLGDESPVPGATYSRIVRRPQINASDDVLFHARLGGTAIVETLFVRSGATGAISRVVGAGDALPTGGVIDGIRDARLADDGAVLVHVKINGDSARRFGLFRFAGGVAAPILASDDPPPTDRFTPPHRYTAFEPFLGLSADGGTVGLVARVRDGARPASKMGALRCEVE